MIKEYTTKHNIKLFIEDNGNIYNEKHVLIKQMTSKLGYMSILKRDDTGKRRRYLVHRLVAAAFIGNVDGKQVHHIDQVVDHNCVENLQIVTQKEHDNIHKWKHPRYRTCIVCGKIFEPYESKRDCAKTCSKECKNKLMKLVTQKRKRPIIQLSLNDEIIKIWNSARDVQNELKYLESNINKCCNNKIKTYKGFKWRYLDETIQN